MDNKEFFSEIYKDCDEGYITLTLLPKRKTLWFKVSELNKLCDAVKKYGTKTNTFFGVGLRKKILPRHIFRHLKHWSKRHMSKASWEHIPD